MNLIIGVLVVLMLCFAVMSIYLKDLLASVISMAAVGLFASILFLILQAPDVAMAEASIGSALVMLIFIFVISKTRGREEK